MAEPVIYRPGLKISFRKLSPEREDNGRISRVALINTVGAACGIGTVKPASRRLGGQVHHRWPNGSKATSRQVGGGRCRICSLPRKAGLDSCAGSFVIVTRQSKS